METAQINARMSPELKHEVDVVLAQYGVSTTEAIRSLWDYLATSKELPSYMNQTKTKSTPASVNPSSASQEGAGLALKLAQEHGLASSLDSISYEELRDLAFEESLIEGKTHV